MNYSNEQLIKMYEQLVLGRNYEEKIVELVNKGELQGFFHLAIGQEAVGVGIVDAIDSNDYLVPTHRFHPGLANKLDLKKLTAELLGRSSGYNKGKAFTFHISSKEENVLPVNGMLGAGIPTAVGYGWALKQAGKNSVVVCVLGDGAASEGNVHEGMNLASLFDVPIVFAIENNKWAISNHFKNQTKTSRLSRRAEAYGMSGITVNGNDVIKVRNAMEKAIIKAREGNPNIVEMMTYRWRGHFEGDPASYRDPEELKDAQEECPIKRLKEMLLNEKIVDKKIISKIDNRVKEKIEDAFEYAKNCPMPTPEETLDLNMVYATNLGGDLK